MNTTPLPRAITPRRANRRAASGYSLMETLLAIGIFTLGFVGVAAIFPAAAALQKNSAEQLVAEISQRNAKAIATSTNKLTYKYDTDPPIVPGEANPIGDLGAGNYFVAGPAVIPLTTKSTVECPITVQTKWSLDMRSYPSSRANLAERDLYWIPLIRSTSGDPSSPNWVMYVAVLRRQNNISYAAPPQVLPPATPALWPTGWTTSSADYIRADTTNTTNTANATVPGITLVDVNRDATINKRYLLTNSDARCKLRPGDWILSQNTGTIFKVIAAGPNYIDVNGTIAATGSDRLWVGVPGVTGNKNPLQAIFTIVDAPAPHNIVK
jgi:type II secretory pathway pseudopilin PulG